MVSPLAKKTAAPPRREVQPIPMFREESLGDRQYVRLLRDRLPETPSTLTGGLCQLQQLLGQRDLYRITASVEHIQPAIRHIT